MRTIMKVLCAAALLAVFLSAVSADLDITRHATQLKKSHHHHRPDFCHDRDCPHFKIKGEANEYQERKYDSAAWVGTNVTGWRFETAAVRGFTRLFRYFNGANRDETKFNMTTPVLTAFRPENNFTTASQNFTVSFYLPDRYQEKDSPPKPTDEEVFRLCTPSGRLFVSNFTGIALEGTVLQQAKQLAEALTRDEVDFVDDAFLFASYDPPQQLTNRYNEVWFMEKREDEQVRKAAAATVSYVDDLATSIIARLQRVFGL